jgi:NAD(P)H-hydrate epimerase
VYLLGDPRSISTPEASANWVAITKAPYSIETKFIRDSSETEDAVNFEEDAIVVDALLGAGIKGKVKEPIASCIERINALASQHKVPVVAVDVPSGMDMDTGKAASTCIRTTRTVTFHMQKKGLVSKPDEVGEIDVVSIGIPPEASWLIGKGNVKQLLKHRRDPRSVKGKNGKVLVIGGSGQYSGAPILAALAATRCGVDLVNLCVPEAVALVAKTMSPDLIATSLSGSKLVEAHLPELEKKIEWADAVVIGMGAGRDEHSAATLVAACKHAIETEKWLVVDADALKAVATSLDAIDGEHVVVTPHAGEFSILSGTPIEKLATLEDKLQAAAQFCKKHPCTLLMKGPEDIVMNRKACKINVTHTPAMTTGGTGDVLAGLTGGLLSLFVAPNEKSPYQTACAAIHVNGLAGLQVEKQRGGPFITASAMVDQIPSILARFW